MEERKSMGSALVDVFDAGVVLVKSEINGVARKAGDLAKAKGIGVALVLASVGPLIMGLIFLLLWFFYLLRGWGLADSMAAFVIAALSLLVTGALIFLGVQKLGAEVKTDMPRNPVPIGPAQSSVPVTPAAPVGAAIAAGQAANAAEKHPDGLYVKDIRYAADHVPSESAHRSVQESAPSGNDHPADPNLQHPVVIKGSPGISVSTRPTYPDDMKREGY